MAYNAEAREFDPDKKVLKNLLAKSSSLKEAGKMCGVSASTLSRRARSKGLQKDLEQLKSRARRTLGDKISRGIQQKRNSQGKKNNKTAKKRKSSTKPIKLHSQEHTTNLPLEEEATILEDELKEAQKEIELTDNRQLGDKFYRDLEQRLANLDQSTSDPQDKQVKLPSGASNNKKQVINLLIKIGNYLIDNT